MNPAQQQIVIINAASNFATTKITKEYILSLQKIVNTANMYFNRKHKKIIIIIIIDLINLYVYIESYLRPRLSA